VGLGLLFTHIHGLRRGLYSSATWRSGMPDAQPAPGTKYVDPMKDEVVAGQPCV